MLTALKKRLAPTDRARKEELASQYRALFKYNKREGVKTWLQKWEKVMADCRRQNIPDTAENRPQFDFIAAV